MLTNLLKNSTQLITEKNDCSLFIKCIFNLNTTDMNILQLLDNENGTKIIDLIKKTRKNHSTIHRSLEKLIISNLVYKERKGIKPKGFVDYYHRIPPNQLYKLAEQKLDLCYTQIKSLLHDHKKSGQI